MGKRVPCGFLVCDFGHAKNKTYLTINQPVGFGGLTGGRFGITTGEVDYIKIYQEKPNDQTIMEFISSLTSLGANLGGVNLSAGEHGKFVVLTRA